MLITCGFLYYCYILIQINQQIINFREGSHPDDFSRLTYRKLLEEVCRFANVLKMHGVNKGDRVSIYMPMTLELPIAMLACARIGAVHSIVVSIIFHYIILDKNLYNFFEDKVDTPVF